MSLTDLTKERKQYLALGAIVGVALVVLIVFGVKVSLSSIGEAQIELKELTGKIESADRALSKQSQVREKLVKTSDELREVVASIPPQRNYYSWASELIYAQARLAELEIDAIDEQLSGSESNVKEDEIRLESYALRITSHGGYRHVMRFLEQIEKEHPLVRVTSVDISTGSKSDIHDVQLFLQWPFNLNAVTDSWNAVAEKKQAIEPRGSDNENGEKQ